MAALSTCPPLTRSSVQAAHLRISRHIHKTPIVTCQTLNQVASTPISSRSAEFTPRASSSSSIEHDIRPKVTLEESTADPQINIFFKCENQQRIGAFKVRGAFHALGRLIEMEGLEAVRRKGVVTHSSGNHAQALALAAKTYGIPAHIVMPRISTTSKIAGTQRQGANVIFSGSTSDEREAAVADVIAKTGAILIPPYDHPDIMLGQGTLALELEEQVQTLLKTNPDLDINSQSTSSSSNPEEDAGGHLDAIITTCGGGGMLSGLCTAMSGTGVHVFGAEPRHQGANDAERGLAARPPTRITRVKSLTVADGARTPVGLHPWGVISDAGRCAGVYSADEEQIALALRLAMERAKLFIEPTAALPLAVVLFNEAFRRRVVELLEQRNAAAGRDGRTPRKGWNLGVVLSGGNTTMEALAKIFGEEDGGDRARL